jgi:uncharacterized protein YebE (UPF0316 family)
MENFDLYNWVIFPLLIFLARVCDVSLGTLRSVLASKGHKKLVPFIGFFEVLIWLLAISQIFKNLDGNYIFYIAWALGYATGSYVGLTIEERLAIGIQVVRVITNQKYEGLVQALRDKNFGVTIVDGHGTRGPVKLIYTTVARKKIGTVVELINEFTPNAFYSVEDVKNARIFPNSDKSIKFSILRKIHPIGKEK